MLWAVTSNGQAWSGWKQNSAPGAAGAFQNARLAAGPIPAAHFSPMPCEQLLDRAASSPYWAPQGPRSAGRVLPAHGHGCRSRSAQGYRGGEGLTAVQEELTPAAFERPLGKAATVSKPRGSHCLRLLQLPLSLGCARPSRDLPTAAVLSRLHSHSKRSVPARVAQLEAAEATAQGLSPSAGDVGHSFQVLQPLRGRGQLLLCTEHVI